MQVSFSKMQSLGNDFMVVQSEALPDPTPELVRTLSCRTHGVGFDQLLIVKPDPSDLADIYCRIFNADGSQALQCGNGMRCISRFAVDHGLLAAGTTSIRIRTDGWIVVVDFLADGLLRADMGEPELKRAAIPFIGEGDLIDCPIEVNGKTLRIAVLSLGNPHAVLEVPDVDNFAVEEIGSALQNHACFPNSVNVEFMQCIDRGCIKIRIYERGVGETQACGSGATAAAWVAVRRKLADDRLRVVMPGGELLVEHHRSRMTLTGPAEYVDKEGTVEI